MRLTIPLVLLMLTGCAATDKTSIELPMDAFVSDANSNAATFSAAGLHRLEPLYPVEDARAGRDGCATVRYLLSAEHQLLNVEVMEASTRSFGREAAASVKRWNWSGLPEGTVTQPTWFETRFEFCIETTPGKCLVQQLRQNTQCGGEDVIPVVGYLVRRAI